MSRCFGHHGQLGTCQSFLFELAKIYRLEEVLASVLRNLGGNVEWRERLGWVVMKNHCACVHLISTLSIRRYIITRLAVSVYEVLGLLVDLVDARGLRYRAK